MIESIMYVGIGLLLGWLLAFAIVPLVHDRAVRLTVRRLEARLPQSIAEVQVDKDLLRAEFAMLARRSEIAIEQLRSKVTNQVCELTIKTEALNRLNVERNELKSEVTKLRRELEFAQNSPQSAKKRMPDHPSSSARYQT